MKISKLIIELYKLRLKGFKNINFWIGYNNPPSDYCNFILTGCFCDKSVTLRNWFDKEIN